MDNIGYTKKLYILPFDHRNTFKKMFGVEELTPELEQQIKDFKQIIYDGFSQSIINGIPKDDASILVDEQYGSAILDQAKQDGVVVMYTLEKSGTNLLEMEYGDDWQAHVEKYKPQFCKVLVRYNPDDPQPDRDQKLQVLKKVSDFCHQSGYKLLVEPLVPATKDQLTRVNNDQAAYDATIRPNLTVQMIKEMQTAGVEVDVWKLEGFEAQADYEKVVEQAKVDGRDQVGVVILGRGAGPEKVDYWLKTGAKVPGIIGFAVGRTVFWQALDDYRTQKITRDEAIEQICNNFMHCYQVYTGN